MSRKLTLVLAPGLALVIVAACDQQSSAGNPGAGNPGAPVYAPAPFSPAAAPLMTPSVDGYDRRANRQFRSGLNNDPSNPSGAPGPGSNNIIVR